MEVEVIQFSIISHEQNLLDLSLASNNL